MGKGIFLFLKSLPCVKSPGKITEFKINIIVLVNDDKLPTIFVS